MGLVRQNDTPLSQSFRPCVYPRRIQPGSGTLALRLRTTEISPPVVVSGAFWIWNAGAGGVVSTRLDVGRALSWARCIVPLPLRMLVEAHVAHPDCCPGFGSIFFCRCGYPSWRGGR